MSKVAIDLAASLVALVCAGFLTHPHQEAVGPTPRLLPPTG